MNSYNSGKLPTNRHGVSVLGLIPARGGSKRLPGKNIRPLCGKPLIAWTIEEARKSELITQLICSTEDDDIAEVCHKYGCEVLLRPADLATDDASSIDVVRHASRVLPGYDYVCLLQPTSPLRTAADIDRCLMFATETPVRTEILGPEGYVADGCCYVWPARYVHEPLVWRRVVMPPSIDIDTEEDFLKAERMMRRG